MIRIGGKYTYTYKVEDKTIVKQKRLNIISFRFSIPISRNEVKKKLDVIDNKTELSDSVTVCKDD